MKFPKTLGAAADMLYEMQQNRIAKEREVKELKGQEDALEKHILDNMLPAAGLEGAKGSIGQVSRSPYDYAEIEDWDKFWAYMGKHKAWHLLQKRPSITSLREIWEAGKSVPGAVRKEGYKLNISKVSAK